MRSFEFFFTIPRNYRCLGDFWSGGGKGRLIQIFFQALLVRVEGHFEEGEGHGKDHPDVDHLDIRRCWQAARQPDEAEGG